MVVHAHLRNRTELTQPLEQRPITRLGRRERLGTQQSTKVIHRCCGMAIHMGIDSANYMARGIYDGNRHPFLFFYR